MAITATNTLNTACLSFSCKQWRCFERVKVSVWVGYQMAPKGSFRSHPFPSDSVPAEIAHLSEKGNSWRLSTEPIHQSMLSSFLRTKIPKVKGETSQMIVGTQTTINALGLAFRLSGSGKKKKKKESVWNIKGAQKDLISSAQLYWAISITIRSLLYLDVKLF